MHMGEGKPVKSSMSRGPGAESSSHKDISTYTARFLRTLPRAETQKAEVQGYRRSLVRAPEVQVSLLRNKEAAYGKLGVRRIVKFEQNTQGFY